MDLVLVASYLGGQLIVLHEFKLIINLNEEQKKILVSILRSLFLKTT